MCEGLEFVKTNCYLYWNNEHVHFLDQTRLPSEECWLAVDSYEAVIEAIEKLRIRGAPAIGIAAAYGLYFGARQLLRYGVTGEQNEEKLAQQTGIHGQRVSPEFAKQQLTRIEDEIGRSRPTAVNLHWALNRMRSVWEPFLVSLIHKGGANIRNDDGGLTWTEQLLTDLLETARKIQLEDELSCIRIGEAGAEELSKYVQPNGSLVLMTYCNTGSLATARLGTALGIIHKLAEQGVRLSVYVPETRPLLQGARLTSWELRRAGIDATLITDNAIASVLQQKGVRAIVVGADRITRDGSVANKIGTYTMAVLARHHNIPFYVAAPISTFDPKLERGADIPIEERHGDEVRFIAGSQIAPNDIRVYNPAFDVTPGDLVTAFVTDVGVLTPPYRESIANRLFAQSGI